MRPLIILSMATLRMETLTWYSSSRSPSRSAIAGKMSRLSSRSNSLSSRLCEQPDAYGGLLDVPQPSGEIAPLILAARSGCNDAVQALLALGASVSTQRVGKRAKAVIFSVKHEHWDVVESLVRAGAPWSIPAP